MTLKAIISFFMYCKFGAPDSKLDSELQKPIVWQEGNYGTNKEYHKHSQMLYVKQYGRWETDIEIDRIQ